MMTSLQSTLRRTELLYLSVGKHFRVLTPDRIETNRHEAES